MKIGATYALRGVNTDTVQLATLDQMELRYCWNGYETYMMYHFRFNDGTVQRLNLIQLQWRMVDTLSPHSL